MCFIFDASDRIIPPFHETDLKVIVLICGATAFLICSPNLV